MPGGTIKGGAPAGPVLVLDADQADQQLLQAILQSEGLCVTLASNSREALAQARRQPPLAVICDPVLPDGDARALSDQLRRVCGDGLPILVVSAAEKVAQLAQEIGAFSFLEKPFDPEHLLVAVLRGMRSSKA